MAYYDALIAKWPTVPGATEQEKLNNLNAEKVSTGVDKLAVLPVSEIVNAFDSAEFVTLASLDIQKLMLVLSGGTVDVSKNSNIRKIILAIFSGKNTTLANLQAVGVKNDTTFLFWWQATVAQGGGELKSPVTHNDLTAAGLV